MQWCPLEGVVLGRSLSFASLYRSHIYARKEDSPEKQNLGPKL